MTAQQSRPGGRPRAAGSAFGGASQILELDTAHELSAWLRGAVNARLVKLDTYLAGHPLADQFDVAQCALSGRRTRPGEREDRTCDRCRTYCPPGRPFTAFLIRPRPNVQMIAGLCGRCLAREEVAA